MRKQKYSQKILIGKQNEKVKGNGLKEYYQFLLPKIMNRADISQQAAIFIIFLTQMIEISFLIPYNFKENQDSMIQLFINSFQYFHIENILAFFMEKSKALVVEQSITFSFNCFLFLTFLILYLLYKFNGQVGSNVLNSFKWIGYVKIIYPKLFYLIILETSASVLVNQKTYQLSSIGIIANLNIAATLILGVFFELHDFDFSFKQKNQLAKRLVMYDGLRFVLVTISIIINKLENKQIMYIYMLSYGIIKTSLGLIFQSYKSINVQKAYIILCFFYTSMSFCFTLCEIINSQSSFLIYILITCTLTIKTGISLFNSKEAQFIDDFLMIKDVTTLTDYQLDKLVRLIISQLQEFYKHYVTKEYGIIFEAVHAHHFMNCSGYDCFCKQFKRSDSNLDKEECSGQEYRYEFMQAYTMHLIEQFISIKYLAQKGGISRNINYLYICFLTEVMKIPTKSYWQLYKIKNQFTKVGDLSILLDQYTITAIEEEMKEEFKYLFENSSIENQRINMIGAIEFDNKFEMLITTFKQQLLSVGSLYDFLCDNLIKLNELENKVTPLQIQNQQIISLLYQLYDLNPFNINLQYISSLYIQVLDLENRKITTLQRESLRKIKEAVKLNSKNGLKQNIEDDIFFFGEDSCVIYSSLISEDLNITKASSTFQDLFGIQTNLIIQKSINTIIPTFFHYDHQESIKNFLSIGKLNIIRQGEINVFAQHKQGYIFPIKIKLKVENLEQDFGVCAAIKKSITHKEYIFFQENGMIINISKGLIDILTLNNLSQLSKLNVYEIIPLLHAVQQAGETNEVFNTIMMPLSQSQILKYKRKSISSQGQKQLQYNLNPQNQQYIISFGFKKFKSSSLTHEGYNYVEIENIQLEKNSKRKIQQIKILTKSLKKIFQDIGSQDFLNEESESISPRSPQMVNKLRTRIVSSLMRKTLDKRRDNDNNISNSIPFNEFNKSASTITRQRRLKKATIVLQQVSNHREDEEDDEFIEQEESISKLPNQLVKQNDQSFHQFNYNQPITDLPSTSRILIGNKNDYSNIEFIGQGQDETVQTNLFSPQQQNNYSTINLLDASNNNNVNSLFSSQVMQDLSPKKVGAHQKRPPALFTFERNEQKHKSLKLNSKQEQSSSSGDEFYKLVLKLKKDISNQKSVENSEVFHQELSTNLNKQSSICQELESPLSLKSSKRKIKSVSTINEQKGRVQIAAYQTSFAEHQDNRNSYSSEENNEEGSDTNAKDMASQMLQGMKYPNFQENDQDEDKESISEQFKDNQKNEIASVNSSKFSQVELSKRALINQIKSTNSNNGLTYMLYTGILSSIAITVLTTIMNNKGYQSLVQYQKDYQRLDISVGLLINILNIIKTKSYGDLANRDVFNDFAFSQVQLKQSTIESYDYLQEYLEKSTKLLNNVNSQLQMEKLTQEQYEITLFTQLYEYNPDKTIVQIKTKVKKNLIEFILLFLQQVTNYIQDFQPEIENNLWENIENFHNAMLSLQKIIQEEVLASFDTIYDQQIFIIVTILIVSSILVLIVIPISIYVKIQKEKIFKLVGSFNPQHLQNQIDNIEQVLHKLDTFTISQKSLQEQKQDTSFKIMRLKTRSYPNNLIQAQIKQHQFNLQQFQDENHQSQNNSLSLQSNTSPNPSYGYISRVSNKRSRTIASFQSIRKVGSVLFFIVFIVVSILMIQPSLNYTILIPFLDEAKVVLSERIGILDITSQLMRNLAPHYQNIWMFLYEETNPNDTLYYDFLKNQREKNIESVNKIQKLILHAKVARRNQYEYNNFYVKLMNENLCEVMINYQIYFNYTSHNIDCEQLFSGIFKRGFLISLQQSYLDFQQLNELYQYDYQQSSILFMKMQEQNKWLYQLHESIKLQMKTVNAINTFQEVQDKEYINYIIKTFSTLYLVQLFLVWIIFCLGWTFIFRVFNNELYESKQIFTLFHINILYQNQFISKYLKKNLFRL